MKNKLITLLTLPVIALSLCSCSIFRATIERSIDVYNLDKLDGNIKSCKTGEVRARFNKNQEYVPYLSLRQYASLYDSHYAEGFTNSISRKGDLVSWSVVNGNSLYFLTQIDFAKKEVVTAGSLDACFKADDDPRDTTSLYYGNNTTYDGKLLGSSYYAHYSFDDYDVDYFSYLGDYYLPLSFYDITYSSDTSLYFYYNYNSIYSSVSVDSFYEKVYVKGNSSYSVISEMQTAKRDSTIPSYLLNFNSNMFLYLLDNFYGLKEYKGIKNATEYCKSIDTYNRLFSVDDAIRTQAYAETLDRLDDNHTALVANSAVWGDTYVARKYGTGCLNRSALRGKLNRIRKEITTTDYQSEDSPLISDDQKTAMIFFNEFKYGSTEQVFNDDGSIKPTAGKYDSFYNLLKWFETLKGLGTIENVVIDIATNGGGVLGVLMKILPLISKDNRGELYYLEAASQQLGIATTQIDSDDNGSFTQDDCYGDDFNFYLLTSDCSFSCGNAFPCLAKRLGYAKIIGEKSGGGECAVAIHYLPNGEYVYHSSNLHLGYYDETTNIFTGFEDGAEVDVSINDYYSFFDVNAVSELIQNN